MSDEKIRLSDGSYVTLDEFITWSAQRQGARLMPIETRQKIANAVRVTHRPVITPKGEFRSARAATIELGIHLNTLTRRIFDLDNPDYRYVTEKPEDIPKYFHSSLTDAPRKIITPLGEFANLKLATKAIGIAEATLKRLIYDTTNTSFRYAVERQEDANKKFDGKARKKERILQKTRAVITPKGRFESLSIASEAYGMGVDVLRRYVFNTAYPEFKYEKEEPRDKEKYFHKIMPKAFQKQTVFVRTPKGDFDSIQLAANAYGIEWHQMNRMVGSKLHSEFYKIEPNEMAKPLINTRSKKKTVTPLGTFNSKIEAIKAHKISRDEFSKLMKSNPKKYYFLDSK